MDLELEVDSLVLLKKLKVLAPSWVLVRNGRRSKQYKDTTAWIIYVYVLDQAFDHLDKTLIG